MHRSTTPGTSRPRRTLVWLTTALATTALALGGAQAATAAQGGADSDGAEHHITGASQAAASAYWTDDRMAGATDADRLAPDAGLAPSVDVDRGSPTTVPSQAPADAGQLSPMSVAPVSHIGKVFFTISGVDYVCSANSVASANERTVATAAHCLHEGGGAWASNFVFAPAYEDGSAPFGVWAATELHAPSAWVQSGDINYDTAFAVVGSPSGTSSTLADTVGASGVAFNQSRGLGYTAFGYPASSPFDGESLETCSGTARTDSWGGTQSQGITCDMTGGSSGGPWFIGAGSGGVQNSVNSFGYDGLANTMFGPYWGSVVQSTYQQAQG